MTRDEIQTKAKAKADSIIEIVRKRDVLGGRNEIALALVQFANEVNGGRDKVSLVVANIATTPSEPKPKIGRPKKQNAED